MKIENIMVKTVELEILEKYFDFNLNENERISIDSFCIYKAHLEIDSDCCFCELIPKLHDGRIQFGIDIPCRIKKYNDEGGYSIRMDKPDFYVTIGLEDYLKRSKEVKLIDFIRYNYNPRIISNQNLLMKHIISSQTTNP